MTFELQSGQHIGPDYTQAPVDGKYPSKKFSAKQTIVSPDNLAEREPLRYVLKGDFAGKAPAKASEDLPPPSGPATDKSRQGTPAKAG